MDRLLKILAFFGIAIGTLAASRAAKSEEVSATSGPLGGEVTQGSSPLGIGNNNPFNLEWRSAINWRGQLGTDGRFVVFDTPLNGIRAGMINIHTKFNRDGANTIRKLIPILSPASENPTEAFIVFVSRKIGASPDQPLQWFPRIIQISQAIIQFENGQQPYSFKLFQQALSATDKT